ncbi:MAG TPA: C39 family peptidase [Candidatus Wallbacteria bacterium]|nr:C39 family peptidase [Candidatus Wallbacteria bacterium]
MKKIAFSSILLSTLFLSSAWCADDPALYKSDKSNLENPFAAVQMTTPEPAANKGQQPSDNIAADKNVDQTLTEKEKKIVETAMDEYDCESFKVDSVSSFNIPDTPQRFRLINVTEKLMSNPPKLVILTRRMYDVHIDEYLPTKTVREVRISLFNSIDQKNLTGKDNGDVTNETKNTTDPFLKFRNGKNTASSKSFEEIKVMTSKFDMSSLDDMKKIAWETFSTGRETKNEELLKKAMDMFQKLVYSTNGSGKYLCYLGRCHAELFFAGKANKRAENELTELKNNAIELYGKAISKLNQEPDESGSVDIAGVKTLLAEIKNNGEMKYFRQPTYNTCQLTSVAMVLSKYGWPHDMNYLMKKYSNTEFEELREEAKSGPGNENHGLERVFNKFAADEGIKVRIRGYVGTLDEMRYVLAQGKPVIVHTYTTSGGHVLVLTGFDETHYTVYDPWGVWDEVILNSQGYDTASSGQGVRYKIEPMDKALKCDEHGNILDNFVWYYDVYPEGFPDGVRPEGKTPAGYKAD